MEMVEVNKSGIKGIAHAGIMSPFPQMNLTGIIDGLIKPIH